MTAAGDHLKDEELGEVLSHAQQAHVERCPPCGRRRATILGVQQAVRGLPRTVEPPASALSLLDAPAAPWRVWRRRHRRGVLATAGAAAACIAVLVLLLRMTQGAPMKDALAEEIALDHLHYEHKASAAEITGSREQIGDFFERTLERRPRIAELEAANIVGGKRCRIGGEWSALIWIERAGRWLSLFSLPGEVVASRGCVHSAGVSVCGVRDPTGGSRVLAGKLPDSEMLRMLDESME